MKILLTGGAGFIGSAVVRQAIWRGHQVVNVDALTYAACLDNVASVSDHWLNSTPPNQIVQFILAGILLVVSFPSQVCQALVIFVFLRQVFHSTSAILNLIRSN